METRTVDTSIQPGQAPTETAPGLRRENVREPPSTAQQLSPASPKCTRPTDRLRSRLGSLLLAVGVSTVPVVYAEPRDDLRRSLASTLLLVSTSRHRGRVLTLRQVWQQVGRVLEEAEQRRMQQRQREYQELVWFMLDEDT